MSNRIKCAGLAVLALVSIACDKRPPGRTQLPAATRPVVKSKMFQPGPFTLYSSDTIQFCTLSNDPKPKVVWDADEYGQGQEYFGPMKIALVRVKKNHNIRGWEAESVMILESIQQQLMQRYPGWTSPEIWRGSKNGVNPNNGFPYDEASIGSVRGEAGMIWLVVYPGPQNSYILAGGAFFQNTLHSIPE